MPAKSDNQQQAAGLALAAKRGEKDPSELKGAAKEMYESMSEDELKEFAETSHEDKPEKKEKNASETNSVQKTANDYVNERLKRLLK